MFLPAPGGVRPDVSIVSSGHDLADARLHRLAAAFQRIGLTVEVLALGQVSDAPAGVSTRVVARGRRPGQRVVSALTAPLRARGRMVAVLDPDALPTALARRAVGGPLVLADVHEDYRALVRDRPWSRPRRVVATGVALLGEALARRADLTAVADDHVPPLQARRRVVVRNLPDVQLLPSGPVDARPRAVYIGDVRRSRGLQAMLAAVEAAPGWTLDVVGPVAPDDAAWLEGWCRASPAASRVRVHGRRPPAESWGIAAGAWAGLALLEDTPAFRDAIPTKLYEYLGAGIPVVVTDLPRMRAAVAGSAAGVVVDSWQGASDTLQRWAADSSAEREHRRQAALQWAATNLAGSRPFDQLASQVRMLLPRTGEDRGRARPA